MKHAAPEPTLPRLIAIVPPALADIDLAGQPLQAHWEAIARALPDGTSTIVVDGCCALITPATLTALLQGGEATLVAEDTVIAVARDTGEDLSPVGPQVSAPPDEQLRVTDAWTATQAARTLLQRRVRAWVLAGAHIIDPERTWIGPQVVLEPGCTLWPDVVLRGTTQVSADAVIRERVSLDSCIVGEGATIKPGTVGEGAIIGPRSQVGPMAHLRAGTVLEGDNKVGNFVETKKARLASGAKASHLTYLGDAEVGAKANIGAGTIPCNYDGFGKHRTQIGAGAFIGSNSSLVAPVTIGDGAIVGAGSVIVRDVPDATLTIGRGRQKDFPGKAPGINARNAERAAAAKRAKK